MQPGSNTTFLTAFNQRVFAACGLSDDLSIVGSLSDDMSNVNISEPDKLRQVLSAFIAVHSPRDVLDFVRQFGFPARTTTGPDWADGWHEFAYVQTCLDLAATFRLMYELVEGLTANDSEHLLFENVLLGSCEDPADVCMVFDSVSISKSTFTSCKRSASLLVPLHPFQRSDVDLYLFFHPRGYQFRWTGSIAQSVSSTAQSRPICSPYLVPSYDDPAITIVRKAASAWVRAFLNACLKDVHPVVEFESGLAVTKFEINSLTAGFAWTLYAQLTGAISLARCPHPKCGALFSRTRNKSSCGSDRCAQYVTRMRREEKAREANGVI